MKEKLPKYLNIDTLSVQVMSPQKKGALGVESLNRYLQESLNPKDKNKAEKELYGRVFRLGDKVMQVKNNYQLAWEIPGKFNVPIEEGEGIQGSEYDAVILPMYRGPQILMTRNLLYTAVTRAKSCVCLLGDPRVFRDMIHNETEQKRYSGLREQLMEMKDSALYRIENPFSNEEEASYGL